MVTVGGRGGGEAGGAGWVGREESARSQAREGGGTHTPNHASAERAKWKRVGGNETDDETPC